MRRVHAVLVPPAGDDEVHRHEHDLEEHEEEDEVEREEHADQRRLEDSIHKVNAFTRSRERLPTPAARAGTAAR